MKILILERIPTSGKSSVALEISELLESGRVKVYGEQETHEPIMNETTGLHVEFFRSFVHAATASGADLVILDRFHLTQALRAKASLGVYAEIEDMLAKHAALIAYLQVDDTAIAERLGLTAERRDKDPTDDFQWAEYFHSKGETFEEIAQHYAGQQRNYLELLKQSKLSSRIFNTTRHEYQVIARQIINEWFSRP